MSKDSETKLLLMKALLPEFFSKIAYCSLACCIGTFFLLFATEEFLYFSTPLCLIVAVLAFVVKRSCASDLRKFIKELNSNPKR